MPSLEDFKDFNRLDADLAAEQKRQGDFIRELQDSLIETSVRFYPETELHKEHFIEALTIKAHERAVLLNEDLDMILGGYTGDDIEFYNTSHVPPRDVTEEEKLYLEDILKTLPPEQHASFIADNKERVDIEAREREFVFLCYDKAKELVVKYFPELVGFSGNALRKIDITTYQQMDEWTYDFCYYAGDYINDY